MPILWVLLLALTAPSHSRIHVNARTLHQPHPRVRGVTPCIDKDHPLTIVPRSSSARFVSAAESATVTSQRQEPLSAAVDLDLLPLEGEGEGVSSAAATPNSVDGGMQRDGPISYHGGSVMTGDLSVYLVWYGNWSRSNPSDVRTMNLLTHVAKYLSNSSWTNINRQYYQQTAMSSTKQFAKGRLTYRGSVIVPSPNGTTLITDDALQEILSQMIMDRKLPFDPENGIIMVQTSGDLDLYNQGLQFCRDVCGYHNTFDYKGKLGAGIVKYGFTGTMARCYNKCSSFTGSNDTRAPNEPNADSMATILAHEVVEIISDYNFDAWYDGQGLENADICIWRYSKVQHGKRTDGSFFWYTHLLGGKPFLIQDNFSPAVGSDGGQLGCVGSGA